MPRFSIIPRPRSLTEGSSAMYGYLKPCILVCQDKNEKSIRHWVYGPVLPQPDLVSSTGLPVEPPELPLIQISPSSFGVFASREGLEPILLFEKSNTFICLSNIDLCRLGVCSRAQLAAAVTSGSQKTSELPAGSDYCLTSCILLTSRRLFAAERVESKSQA